MATIEIDEQVARKWRDHLKAHCLDSRPWNEVVENLYGQVAKALPPELEVGWHEVEDPLRRQSVLWWNGREWTKFRAGLRSEASVVSVKYLGA